MHLLGFLQKHNSNFKGVHLYFHIYLALSAHINTDAGAKMLNLLVFVKNLGICSFMCNTASKFSDKSDQGGIL